MRLVRRQELMTLPPATLYAELHKPWVFGELLLKGETIVRDGVNADFWLRTTNWPDADDPGEAIDRLEEMAADSMVSYPINPSYQRHGLYDDEQVFLVYEPGDTAALVAELGNREDKA